jgi:hypothetical protein
MQKSTAEHAEKKMPTAVTGRNKLSASFQTLLRKKEEEQIQT